MLGPVSRATWTPCRLLRTGAVSRVTGCVQNRKSCDLLANYCGRAAKALRHGLLPRIECDDRIADVSSRQRRREPVNRFDDQVALTIDGDDVVAVVEHHEFDVAGQLAAQVGGVAERRIIVFQRVHDQ